MSELAASVTLPRARWFDLRGPSGVWIDYFIQTYPEWARASEPAHACARPWPVGFAPTATPIFAHNEITIAAEPNRVFAVLRDARAWSTYYENASHVRLPNGVEQLGADLHFDFTTFGVAFRAQISVYELNRALAWTCVGGLPELSVHHRWLLEPIPGGTRLVTEETNFISQLRSLKPLNRWLNAQLAGSGTLQALPAAHQRWLTELKRVVEGD